MGSIIVFPVIEGCSYLDEASTKSVLEVAPMRVDAVEEHFFSYTEPFILHDGKWKPLTRTDLNDDVATSRCTSKTVDRWREFYAELVCEFGARYNDERFSVIDRRSDG